MRTAVDLFLRALSHISISVEVDVDHIIEWTKNLLEVMAHF